MLVLTTSSGHPFIGIDKPVRTVITDNLTTLYYPLSSQVAVILTDDGQHTFEKDRSAIDSSKISMRLLLMMATGI